MTSLVFPKQQVNLRVAREHLDVLMQIEGRAYRIPYQAALRLAAMVRDAAKACEEEANAEQIAFDGAVLLRAGVPLGLTSNPALMEEVKKEAVNNRTIRRSALKGIKSKEVFGRPTLVQGPPPEETTDED